MKYDMRICRCGRIHMIDNNRINSALKKNKNLLIICAGCGAATLIGADVEMDWTVQGKEVYMMYSNEFSASEDSIITSSDFKTTDNHKAIEEIIYSQGLKVPMMSGQYATDYFNGIFSDRWYPDFYKIQRDDITVKEIMNFIDEFNHDRTTVNMDRFIYESPEDMLDEISRYSIKGLNWVCTKWENKG